MSVISRMRALATSRLAAGILAAALLLLWVWGIASGNDLLVEIGVSVVAVLALAALALSRRKHMQLEAALRASEEQARLASGRLVDAIESMQDGFSLWDADERLVLFNTAARQKFLPSDEVLRPGITVTESISAYVRTQLVDINDHETAIEQALNRHRHVTGERIERRLQNGRWAARWVQETREGGRVVVWHDITDQKQAEAALRDSEEKVRLAHARLMDALDNLHDGFMLWDKDDRLVLYNQATFGRIYSADWHPKLGTTYTEYAAELLRRGEVMREGRTAAEALHDALKGRHGHAPPEIEYRLKDGRWILARRRRTTDGGVVSVLTDVTALKVAQLAAEATARDLEEKKRQLDTAIEHMDEGLAFYDPDMRLILCNQQYRDIFRLPEAATRPGIHLSEVVGESVRIGNYTPEDAPHMVERRLASATRGEPHQDWVRFTDGRVVETAYQPLRGGGMVATYRDVTDRVHTTEALIAAKDAAEAANKAKTNFLAQMSHELRTPLNAIIGFSEIIHGRQFGDAAIERYADYAGDIHSAGEHLLCLINDVLHMARQEASPQRLSDDTVDIAEQVSRACTMLERAAVKGHVEITQRLSPDLPALRADGRLVLQVFVNLLSNAVKFTPPGGHVTIAADADRHAGLWITVADTGIGIPAEDRARVFEPFFQAAAPPGRVREGTGLGLSICRNIVELHGGSISIASEAGTSVRVHFPATRLISKRNRRRSAG
jgi:signal transduction histidine kinase